MDPVFDERTVQQILPGYPVSPRLLKEALTHKSADASGNNERLEFLGDAVLELALSDYLYHTYPDYTEGQLSKARAMAVCEPSLAEAAQKLHLGEYLIMSKGEEMAGGRSKPSILADAFEAVVAVIYLSLGLEKTKEFVVENLGHTLQDLRLRDFKSLLQEFTQAEWKLVPVYRIVEEKGPAHDRWFVAVVEVGGKEIGRGEGKSKKEAEQAAAEVALEVLSQWREGL